MHRFHRRHSAKGTPARRAIWMSPLGGLCVLLVVLGLGVLQPGTSLAEARASSPAASSAVPPPTARFGASMAYDSASGQLLLFGGDTKHGKVSKQTWIFDGSSWAQLHPASSPPARGGASMAYDTASSQLVLFGGASTSSGFLNDTWTWDASDSDWVQASPAASPSARSDASMAYDGGTSQLVLFGGGHTGGASKDTWTWDGSTWTQLFPEASPQTRIDAPAAYDPSSRFAVGQFVLFGGLHSISSDLNDTWTWNGADWILAEHYPVAFVPCNFSNWKYKPNNLAYYQSIWTDQSANGVFSSYPDYIHDESYGQMDLAGSTVLPWVAMSISTESETDYGGQTLQSRWLACINAAAAAGKLTASYSSIITVGPSVTAEITGNGLAAQPMVTAGQHPPAETFTVDSLTDFPPAPFSLGVSGSGVDENDMVTNVTNNQLGATLTVVRGDGGATQAPGPFAAVAPGGEITPLTNDDQAIVGPVEVYYNANGQPCRSGSGTCPLFSFSAPGTPYLVGIAGLEAGDDEHDSVVGYQNWSATDGDTAHEVGHSMGYNHSRALATSTQEYQDCFDQMSWNCELPGFPGEAGTSAGQPDGEGIVSFDAINLEFGGWIPYTAIDNAADQPVQQSTIILHALSDPNALQSKVAGFLDAHIPAQVSIEDVSPQNVAPTFPSPTCTGSGFHCATSQYYTVEYRQLYGFDQSLSPLLDGATSGGAVLLHLYAPDAADTYNNISYLVNVFPGQGTKGKPIALPNGGALQPGDVYADPAHNTYVAVNSFDTATKTAKVTISSAPIAPTITLSAPASGMAGSSVALSADLSVDGAPVPDQTVSLDVQGSPACQASTDSDGMATCSVVLGSDTGQTVATATFAGDSAYSSAPEATSNFDVS
jgi:hypothetical protein